ncbi:hypothetical protein JTB14_013305 [Gonioctena quinquepunctata]|nr:hypothetical protein JTB14_013305 [Gonioctena quinquepunctata]
MSFLLDFFRCLCLCIIIEKGSWNPNTRINTNKHHRTILKNRFEKLGTTKKDKALKKKPDWLKEWTISKGWVHNKSHLLNLGAKTETMDGKNYEELSEESSVSLENIEDLISIKSVSEIIEDNKNQWNNESSDDSCSAGEESSHFRKSSNINNMSLIFQQMTQNYRDNFPDCSCNSIRNVDSILPAIYKERLLVNENRSRDLLGEIWKYVRPKRKKKISLNNYKFTANQLYEEANCSKLKKKGTVVDKYTKKNSLGRNIALYNTLNSKTNLHEEPIYECSEENSNYNSLNNVYLNPIYSPEKFQRFNSYNNQVTVLDRPLGNQQNLRYQNNELSKSKLRTEKYVIRHIRVRIMLSLRVGRLQKLKKKPKAKNNKLCNKNFHSAKNIRGDDLHSRVARIHEEQRRIGNGKSSIKIQNMRQCPSEVVLLSIITDIMLFNIHCLDVLVCRFARYLYGRLNVLRWLLWEAESREDMPALEKVATNNTTLALHYAAARGCLDCVRLLVDSSPELRYVCALFLSN